LAIRKLAISSGHIKRLEIDELVVGKLVRKEEEQ